MLGFIARRLAYLVFTMFVVSLLVFTVSEYSPGDVARKILGQFATPEQVARLTAEMRLDRPVLVRYFEWAGNVLSGDLGQSTRLNVPVGDVLADRLWNTTILAMTAFAVIVPLSILLGVLAGMREGSPLDRGISLLSIVTTSLPEFATGVFLAAILVTWLGVLPGTATLTNFDTWSFAAQLVLPVLVMVLYDAGYVVRMVRASMVEVMSRPYIRTAVLKGMNYRQVIWRHALRNAMITPFTVILLQINYLVTGVVVVEALFAYPGFGRLMLEAALAKDIAIVQIGALVAVFVAVMTQILGDLGYMLLNPRIRLQ